MMAMTTNNSISVNPRRSDRRFIVHSSGKMGGRSRPAAHDRCLPARGGPFSCEMRATDIERGKGRNTSRTKTANSEKGPERPSRDELSWLPA